MSMGRFFACSVFHWVCHIVDTTHLWHYTSLWNIFNTWMKSFLILLFYFFFPNMRNMPGLFTKAWESAHPNGILLAGGFLCWMLLAGSVGNSIRMGTYLPKNWEWCISSYRMQKERKQFPPIPTFSLLPFPKTRSVSRIPLVWLR